MKEVGRRFPKYNVYDAIRELYFGLVQPELPALFFKRSGFRFAAKLLLLRSDASCKRVRAQMMSLSVDPLCEPDGDARNSDVQDWLDALFPLGDVGDSLNHSLLAADLEPSKAAPPATMTPPEQTRPNAEGRREASSGRTRKTKDSGKQRLKVRLKPWTRQVHDKVAQQKLQPRIDLSIPRDKPVRKIFRRLGEKWEAVLSLERTFVELIAGKKEEAKPRIWREADVSTMVVEDVIRTCPACLQSKKDGSSVLELYYRFASHTTHANGELRDPFAGDKEVNFGENTCLEIMKATSADATNGAAGRGELASPAGSREVKAVWTPGSDAGLESPPGPPTLEVFSEEKPKAPTSPGVRSALGERGKEGDGPKSAEDRVNRSSSGKRKRRAGDVDGLETRKRQPSDNGSDAGVLGLDRPASLSEKRAGPTKDQAEKGGTINPRGTCRMAKAHRRSFRRIRPTFVCSIPKVYMDRARTLMKAGSQCDGFSKVSWCPPVAPAFGHGTACGQYFLGLPAAEHGRTSRARPLAKKLEDAVFGGGRRRLVGE
eukprot:scaffold576_cov260-Pinguiococcus_pyrenoidosus.AAC.61